MSTYKKIAEELDELHGRINPNDLSWLKDVEKTFSFFTKFNKLEDFATRLEQVKKELQKDETKRPEVNAIDRLLNTLKKNRPDFLLERLKAAGYSTTRNNENIKNAINDELMRILEQIRLGKKDVVIGMLLRIFAAKNTKIPAELIEILKPKYEIDQFRAFMYAFLGSIIPYDTEEQEKGGTE